MKENKEFNIDSDGNDTLKSILMIGVICSITVIILTVMDIVIGTSLGGNLNAIPATAAERFVQLQNQPLLGLYYLDTLNMVTSILMIPVFTALFLMQRKTKTSFLILALMFFAIGTAIFVNNNASLPMLGLSKQFANALPAQKDLLSAAGESLLIKGAHGSMGAFLGFVLSMMATILMSLSMIQSKIFGKVTGWIGLAGAILLLIYLVLVTFIPSAQSIAMALAAPGGIMSLVWMILYTLKMLRIVRNK